MALSETEVRDALSAVKYPGFSRDIVSFGLVKGIQHRDGDVTVQWRSRPMSPRFRKRLRQTRKKLCGHLRRGKTRKC